MGASPRTGVPTAQGVIVMAALALVRNSSLGAGVSKVVDDRGVLFSAPVLQQDPRPRVLLVTMARPPSTSAEEPFWFKDSGATVDTMRMLKLLCNGRMPKVQSDDKRSSFLFTDAYVGPEHEWSKGWELKITASAKAQEEARKRVESIIKDYDVDVVVLMSALVHMTMGKPVLGAEHSTFYSLPIGSRNVLAVNAYHPRELGFSSTMEPKFKLVAVFDAIHQMRAKKQLSLPEDLNKLVAEYQAKVVIAKPKHDGIVSPSWLGIFTALQSLGSDPLEWWLNHFVDAGEATSVNDLKANDALLQTPLTQHELFVASGAKGRMEFSSFLSNYLRRTSTHWKHWARGKSDYFTDSDQLADPSTAKKPGRKEYKLLLKQEYIAKAMVAGIGAILSKKENKAAKPATRAEQKARKEAAIAAQAAAAAEQQLSEEDDDESDESDEDDMRD